MKIETRDEFMIVEHALLNLRDYYMNKQVTQGGFAMITDKVAKIDQVLDKLRDWEASNE